MKHTKTIAAILLAVIMTFTMCSVAFATDIDSHSGERTLTLQLGKQNAGLTFHLREDNAYSPSTYTTDEKGVLHMTLGDSSDVLLVSELAVADTEATEPDSETESGETEAPETDADGNTLESESASEEESTTEAPAEQKKTILGMSVSSFIIFIVGLVAVGGYFLVDRLYLKKKNQEKFSGDDEYDDYDE